MNARLLRLAVGAVRMWARLYTWRMPQALRDERLREIDSDLWEAQAQRPRRAALPLLVAARLLLGMFDDVLWRAEHMSTHPFVDRRRLLAVGVGVVVLAGMLWAAVTVSVKPPAPPAAPDFRARRTPYPPPPPPPPPLCNPPGVGRPSASPCS